MAHVPKRHPFREAVRHQDPGRLRDQHLPTVGRRRDPSGSMNIQPDVVIAAEAPLTRMHAHPNPDRSSEPFGVTSRQAVAQHSHDPERGLRALAEDRLELAPADGQHADGTPGHE